MPNDEHFKILAQGVCAWNEWRQRDPTVGPDLSGANLSYGNFSHANFSSTILAHANLSHANLEHATLTTDLEGANLEGANLSNANLRHADLAYANLSYARLRQTNFTKALLGWTKLGDIDLSEANGLGSVRHNGPSIVGIDTLYRSAGKIPKQFLEGCGVPEELITFLPDLIIASQPIQFYSCFISYSHKDQHFAQHIYSSLRDLKIRVWFAMEDMKAGDLIQEQIYRAIQLHDKLLLVLSENSLTSDWVMTEIRRARKVERAEHRRKLFPIRLVNFEAIERWECFDADSGKDLAVELREYYIPDFSNWKDRDTFAIEFAKLLRDLKATG